MKILKKDILSKIQKRRKDSLWRHFLTSFETLGVICADVEKNKISVWNRNFMLGNFYPVFELEFNENNELIKVSDRLNSFGKLSYLLILLGFSLPFFISIVNIDFNINNLLLVGGIYIVFLTILLLISRAVYKFEKKESKDFYFRLFDIEENTEKPVESPNEWSLKNSVKRVFTYLFCCFVLVSGFYVMVIDNSKDKPSMVILGALIFIVLPMVYIYTDLKILFKRK